MDIKQQEPVPQKSLLDKDENQIKCEANKRDLIRQHISVLPPLAQSDYSMIFLQAEFIQKSSQRNFDFLSRMKKDRTLKVRLNKNYSLHLYDDQDFLQKEILLTRDTTVAMQNLFEFKLVGRSKSQTFKLTDTMKTVIDWVKIIEGMVSKINKKLTQIHAHFRMQTKSKLLVDENNRSQNIQCKEEILSNKDEKICPENIAINRFNKSQSDIKSPYKKSALDESSKYRDEGEIDTTTSVNGKSKSNSPDTRHNQNNLFNKD